MSDANAVRSSRVSSARATVVLPVPISPVRTANPSRRAIVSRSVFSASSCDSLR